MDWAKVKTFFILLLLCLNVFLTGSLLYGARSGASSDAYLSYADKILADRGILSTGEWPVGPPEAGMLQFDNEESDAVLKKILDRLLPGAEIIQGVQDGKLREYQVGTRSLVIGDPTGTGNVTIHFTDTSSGYRLDTKSEQIRTREVKALLKAIGLGAYHLVQDTVRETKDGTVLSFVQPYEKGHIFDNRVSLVLNDSGVSDLLISLRTVRQKIAPPGGGSWEVLSARQALILSPLRGPLQIREMSFGWSQENAGQQYFSPIWRILTEDGQEYRLNGYTGVLRQQ